MTYQAIFFDVDDTLLNFGHSGKNAMEHAFAAFDLSLNDEVYATFTRLNNGLWTKQKQGQMKVEEVINTRFGLLFDELGWHVDAEAFKESYQAYLGQQAILEDGASEVIAYLSERYRLYAASNSVLSLQISRLSKAQLLPHFTDLFISSDIGYEKPDTRFFQECLRRSGLKYDEVLFVGDSLEADMHGAVASAIPACWYNAKQLPAPSGLDLNHQIQHLNELKNLL